MPVGTSEIKVNVGDLPEVKAVFSQAEEMIKRLEAKVFAYEYLIGDLLKAWDEGGPREDRNLADPIQRLREEMKANATAPEIAVCLCPVVTGGHLAVQAHCPVHGTR